MTIRLAAGLLLGLAPSLAAADVSCGTVVGKGPKVTLTADVGPCDGNSSSEAAIIVDSGTLDLGGQTVTCADQNQDGDVPQGIVLFGKKARVTNGVVVGCMNGIALGGSGKHLVQGVTSRDSADDGFDAAPGADKCKLIGDTATGNLGDGVSLRSDKNKIVDTTASTNADDGFAVFSSSDKNKFVNARAEANADEGFIVAGAKNKLTGPVASQNGTYGIDLYGARNKAIGGSAQGNGAYDLETCAGSTVKKLTYATSTTSCD
jgi:hypothetical protein